MNEEDSTSGDTTEGGTDGRNTKDRTVDEATENFLEADEPDLNKWWERLRAAIGCAVLAILLVLFIKWQWPKLGLSVFGALLSNLPLTLPILTVGLSIIVNVRQLLRPHGWMGLPTTIALGLVSFAIWYVVSAESSADQVIRISSDKYLTKEYAVLLLIISFLWATICSLARALGETVHPRNRRLPWRLLQGAILGMSFVGLLVPFLLFESQAEAEDRTKLSLSERYFSVSVPYRDPVLARHLGVTEDEIVRCYVYKQLRARDAREAISKAIAKFRAEASHRFVPQGRSREDLSNRDVAIVEPWVVAELEPGVPRRDDSPAR